MTKYRPSILHAYGWIPGLIFRNLKGTVFYDCAYSRCLRVCTHICFVRSHSA